MDGAASEGAGKDGFSPVIAVTTLEDGHRIAITDAAGTRTFDVKNGISGSDGHAPVKGVDYWTSADKAEIIQDVLAALPNASGVNF